MDEINIPELVPKTMKGPNHPFDSLDLIERTVTPHEWRNVPIPVTEAIKKIIHCLGHIKLETFENFNEGIKTLRAM